MHNLGRPRTSTYRVYAWARTSATWAAVMVVSVFVGAGLTACVRPDKDAGRADALPLNQPIYRVYRGVPLYLLRQSEADVVVFWGVSPLEGGERGAIRCFIQDRTDHTFRGETRPFIDPCRSAWWSHDGQFLGYSSDPADAPSAGPPLVRIPAEVRGGRVVLNDAYLRCLHSRLPNCESRL